MLTCTVLPLVSGEVALGLAGRFGKDSVDQNSYTMSPEETPDTLAREENYQFTCPWVQGSGQYLEIKVIIKSQKKKKVLYTLHLA